MSENKIVQRKDGNLKTYGVRRFCGCFQTLRNILVGGALAIWNGPLLSYEFVGTGNSGHNGGGSDDFGKHGKNGSALCVCVEMKLDFQLWNSKD